MDDRPRLEPESLSDGWSDETEEEEELETLVRPWERRQKGRGVMRRRFSEREDGRSPLRSQKGARPKTRPWRRKPSPPEGDFPG